MKWCEIRERTGDGTVFTSNAKRFEILNEELVKLGLATELVAVDTDKAGIEAMIDRARSEFAQIRFSGETGAWSIPFLTRMPSAISSLRSADSLVCEDHNWWPRYFLVEGLNHTFAAETRNIDLNGSLFILGANSKARAVIAALSRIGFGKIFVTDPDDQKAETFVEDMRRSYFGIQFQAVPRTQVTQLPGVSSVAVNTLADGVDASNTSELAYFNFLKPGGIWLDLAVFPLNKSLEAEAVAVGATVVSGYRVLATTDSLWVKAAFQRELDIENYASRLAGV